MNRRRYETTVLGWPAVALALGLGAYALVSLLQGHSDRALVLAVIAAVNGFVGGTILLG